MYRKITMLLLILISYLIQSTMIRILPMGGVAPNLLIILTSSFGFMRGKKEGMFIGFISGLVMDVLFGNIIGFYALVYMVIGYLNGFFATIFYPEDIKYRKKISLISQKCHQSRLIKSLSDWKKTGKNMFNTKRLPLRTAFD